MKKLTTAVFIFVLCHFCFAEIIPLRQAEVLMYHNSILDLADGGKIVSWDEARTYSSDIYAQRFDAGGNPLWAEPLPLATGDETQSKSQLLAASDGNFVAIWQQIVIDGSSYMMSIRAQKFNLLGQPLWPGKGIILPTHRKNYQNYQVLPNPAGGFYCVARSDEKNPVHIAFSISAGGDQLWGNSVMALDIVSDSVLDRIVSDGDGGFIACFQNNAANNSYLVRIDSSGNIVGNNPMLEESPLDRKSYQIFPLLNDRYILYSFQNNGFSCYILHFCIMDSDGTLHGTSTSIFSGINVTVYNIPSVFSAHPDGGFYLVHPYLSSARKMSVRRFSSDGSPVWPWTKACGNDIYEHTPFDIATDLHGNLILIWSNQMQSTLQALKLNSNGIIMYPGESVTLSSGSRDYKLPALAVSGVHAWMVWREELGHQQLLRQQILSNTGQPLLAENREIVSQALAGHAELRTRSLAVGDHYFSFWNDTRGADAKIYMQKTDQNSTQLWESNGRALNGVYPGKEFLLHTQCFDKEHIAVLYSYTGPTDDIYLQLLDQEGQAQYPGLGIFICDDYNFDSSISIGYEDTDYYLVWSGSGYASQTLYGQRVHNGTALWQIGGKVILQTDFDFSIRQTEGSYVFWHNKDASHNDNGHRLLRLDQDGDVMRGWGRLGKPFFSSSGSVTWETPIAVERHADFLYVIIKGDTADKIQKILPDGKLPWGLAGKNISPFGYGWRPSAVSFEDDIFVLFENNVGLYNVNVRLQKVLRNGSLPWGKEGLLIHSTPSNCSQSQLMRFDNGYIVPIWTGRSECSSTNDDIYSAVIDPYGNLQAEGAQLISAPDKQHYPQTAVLGNKGLISWIDQRIGYALGYGEPQSLYATIYDATNLIDDQTQVPGMADVPLLYQNYPNPFNPTTTISFALPRFGEPRISIYNLRGQLIRDLTKDTTYIRGKHSLIWDGKDSGGKTVCTGIYFCRFSLGSHSSSRKMILMK